MLINLLASRGNPFDFSGYQAGDWVDLGISLAICFLVCLSLIFIYKKKAMKLFFGLTFPFLAIFIVFGLDFSALVMGLIIVSGVVITAVYHTSDYRSFFNRSLKFLSKSKLLRRVKGGVLDYDENKLFNQVRETVDYLSRHKIGGLITFQRNDTVTVPSDAVILEAPFVPELVETIFFPNTRLHDLGMIVRGDIIYAASVRYPLSTQVFSGKLGSRHRAAIGMSEQNDSVTVVVSEETGRIHIVSRGKLTPCSTHDFLDTFSNFMREGRED